MIGKLDGAIELPENIEDYGDSITNVYLKGIIRGESVIQKCRKDLKVLNKLIKKYMRTK